MAHAFLDPALNRLLAGVRKRKRFPKGTAGEAVAVMLACEITKDFHTFRALRRLTEEERNRSKMLLHGSNYDGGPLVSPLLDRYSASYAKPGLGKTETTPRTHGEIPMAEDRNSASPDPNADLIVPEKLPKGFKSWRALAQSMSDTARLARRNSEHQRARMDEERAFHSQRQAKDGADINRLIAEVEQLTKTIHLLSR